MCSGCSDLDVPLLQEYYGRQVMPAQTQVSQGGNSSCLVWYCELLLSLDCRNSLQGYVYDTYQVKGYRTDTCTILN